MFSAAVEAYLAQTFSAPTVIQARGWPVIAEGRHALLLAPTGSGKTLAAFLVCIDRLGRAPAAGAGYRVVYVSPLKALAYDIERNLRAPIAAIARQAALLGERFTPPRIAVRTGDTPAHTRRKQLRDPGDILVTTPESLFLMLTSSARETLRDVDTVIVDEAHAIAGQKRGAHLALSLERLAALAERPPQRIGLSATAHPAAEVARFLGGAHEVAIVDAKTRPALELSIESPVTERPVQPGAVQTEGGPWAAIHAALLARIRAAQQTIIFANSRSMAEKLAHDLNALAGETVIRAHHGSLSHRARRQVESLLKSGELPAIAATSSLELGIDMAAVDLVIQLESPRSVARGLQRIGRAGHRAGELSRGVIVPKDRADLAEAAAIAGGMIAGDIEPTIAPQNPLDVLAQHIVSMAAVRPWPIAEIAALARRTHSFRKLPDAALERVIAMLAGELPGLGANASKPRIAWDRTRQVIIGRRGALLLAVTNAGTIPDRGLYPVISSENQARVGELDEEMVYESRVGDTFALGASTWRIVALSHDRVLAEPAPGEPGRLPFWRGDGPGRPLSVGRRLGALYRAIDTRDDDSARQYLGAKAPLDDEATGQLIALVRDQRAHAEVVPSDRAIVVEAFADAVGEDRVCILSPHGVRVHAPWSLAIAARCRSRGQAVPAMTYTDDGIAIQAPPEDIDLFPDPDTIEALLTAELPASALFAGHFRECAARALLLPRRRPGQRTPLWQARLRAKTLLDAAATVPAFPIITETLRECMADVFDLPALKKLLVAIRDREVAVARAATRSPSPLARKLAFAYQAAFLYEGDAPLAERRAQALATDQALLEELGGGESQLSGLLDEATIAAFEAERQRLAPGWQARDADEAHDLLRELGDLDRAEIEARADGDAAAMLEALFAAGRAEPIRLGSRARIIATADAALYAGLGEELGPTVELLLRWARSRGPVSVDEAADRFAIDRSLAAAAFDELFARGDMTALAEGKACATSSLRALRRRALEALRAEIEPVDAAAVSRFVIARHQLLPPQADTPAALDGALARLEGTPLPVSDLLTRILPARVPGFRIDMLDARAAAGDLMWLGCGAIGDSDARVLLCRRAHRAAFLTPPDLEALTARSPTAGAIIALLRGRGASFFSDIVTALGDPIETILATLRDLALAGAITGDSFAALATLAKHRPKKRKPTRAPPRGRRPRPRSAPLQLPGRLSLTSVEGTPAGDDPASLKIVAEAQLARHGIVTRDVAAAELFAGGFSRIAPVLRAMEQVGTVRRGRFFSPLSGPQFAAAEAVDSLRRERHREGHDIVVLAAADPANIFGVLVPWPPTLDGKPTRRAGATLIMAHGVPVWFLDRGQRRLLAFADATDADREQAARHLFVAAKAIRRRTLRIDTIGQDPGSKSPLAPILIAAGFHRERDSLVCEAS